MGDPDVQLICSDPPQNADPFILYVRGGLLELAKGKMENHAVYTEDLSAVFQICHVCLSPVSTCDLSATSGSFPLTKP